METPTSTKAPEIKQPLTRSGYVSRGPVGTSEGLQHSGSKSAAKAPRDAEQVADNARPPYPQIIADDKRLVVGQDRDGRYLQVI